MAKILIVEDDPTARELMRQHLESAGFSVVSAEDGAAGLSLALSAPPQLIVADVRMPKLDGFGLLGALRADARTAAVPLIFVSALEDRESYRHGMNLGADDFLSKPVRGDELLNAVRGRLRRAQMLRDTGERQIISAALARNAELASIDGAQAQPTRSLDRARAPVGKLERRRGSVVVISVRNADAMATGLAATERRELLQAFFSRLCEPILAQHGWVVRHQHAELVAMFESPADRLPDHTNRALRAALLAVLSTHQLRTSLQTRSLRRSGERIEFGIGIAIGSGDVDVLTLADPGAARMDLSGALIDSLLRVDPRVAPLGWSIAASTAVARDAGADFEFGERAMCDETELVEVVGFAPRLASLSGFNIVFDAINEAMCANGALAHGVDLPDRYEQAPREQMPRAATADEHAGSIPGYRILRKLGQGGMSRVYLARHEESSAVHVLKVIPIADHEDDELDALQRFIQEYALVAQIRHPNVARIFGQGFAEHCAYIAMEYLDGGDLRARIEAGIDADECVRLFTHLAQALTALHERGIVHRDLKPDNLMLRADGTLVLADFGIAKQTATHLAKTRHGEVFGTPFYMSPEQACGHEVDHRSDLYSAGVILCEMLTGAKPFTASNAEALVYQHVHADIPSLPGHHWQLQPMLDRLLAKRPEQRYTSALELLHALQALRATSVSGDALRAPATA